MIATATALLQRALNVGVLPTTKTQWLAFTIGFAIGIILDFVGWWSLWPTSFDRCVTVPARRLLTNTSAGNEDQGDDDDPDPGGFAMWVWCPTCDTYRADTEECCRCDAYDEKAAA
jgi:hypothetical protein